MTMKNIITPQDISHYFSNSTYINALEYLMGLPIFNLRDKDGTEAIKRMGKNPRIIIDGRQSHTDDEPLWQPPENNQITHIKRRNTSLRFLPFNSHRIKSSVNTDEQQTRTVSLSPQVTQNETRDLLIPISIREISIPRNKSYGIDLMNIDGTLLFTMINENNGTDLWKVNETGPVFIKNVGSNIYSPQFTNLNGHLAFISRNNVDGTLWGNLTLWRSDGTIEGTIPLKTFLRRYPTFPTLGSLTTLNDLLLFEAFKPGIGAEPWKSDGTPDGTMILKDLNTGWDNTTSSDPDNFTQVNALVFFTARSSNTGPHRLWKTDGSESGTVLVGDADSSLNFLNPQKLTNVNGVLFFITTDSEGSTRLWKSDGTGEGTVLLESCTLMRGKSFTDLHRLISCDLPE